MGFDINRYKVVKHQTDRYVRRLELLKGKGIRTSCIETAVTEAVDNIRQGNTRSFVIYGEPQSGKTEMMIALTARLLDDGRRTIIHLLNDSVQLLEQNLERFQRSGLSPSPCNFTEILDTVIKLGGEERVIFCKKNAKDLTKLIDRLDHLKNKVVIDDEADFASPNAKINKGDRTKINALIAKLLGQDGIYVGVTATPARLDLNNTFENDHEKWVDFPAHDRYTGQDVFFPISRKFQFRMTWLPDTGDDPKHCRLALFGFLVNAAYLNITRGRENYCFLVHTSGQKADHKTDYQIIQKVFGILSDPGNKDYGTYVRQIWEMANSRYPSHTDDVVRFIIDNIGCKNIVVMNSEKKDQAMSYKSATSPSSLFTVAIGGNIVSRGVTFDHLLSMFFTRDVKHKIQQDTYIQRARMFGARGEYLEHFELTIPENLYMDWHRCFVFHRLSLDSIRSGMGAPVWLEDSRIAATAQSSLDKANISLDSGEMSYEIFDFQLLASQIEEVMKIKSATELERLEALHVLLGENRFPSYVISYVKEFEVPGKQSILIHNPVSIEGYKESGVDKTNIARKKGFLGGANYTKNKNIPHHFQVLFNGEGRGRLFYKYMGGSISFLKHLR